MTAATIDRSFDPHIYRVLGGREPLLAGLIAKYGYPPPFEWHDGGRTGDSQFAAMLLHIAGQHISASVAFRIYDRVATACGDIPSAAAVLTLQARRLGAAGLSRAKASYIMALARAQADGVIDLEAMGDLEDAQVIAQLTAIRGIGLWSAQTFLIHNLARPDVLPAGDLGIRRACAALWTMSSLPSPGAVKTRSAAWAPYRSYASALLWCSLAPVEEESDPKARALQRNAASVGVPEDDERHTFTTTAQPQMPPVKPSDYDGVIVSAGQCGRSAAAPARGLHTRRGQFAGVDTGSPDRVTSSDACLGTCE